MGCHGRRTGTAALAAVVAALLLLPGSALAEGSREPSVTFHGAAGCIDGSCHLLDTGRERILLDCGSFLSPQRDYLNYDFPFRPTDPDLVVLSHGHLDHAGRLPLLYALGFGGETLCAPPTRDLLGVMLRVQERIRRPRVWNRPGALQGLREIPYGEMRRLPGGTEIELLPAGHILGAAMVRIRYGRGPSRRTLVFSGDLGPEAPTLLAARARPASAEVAIVESTYGGRSHGDAPKERQTFLRVLREAALDGGIVLVPSFVLSRTQKVLALIHEGMARGEVPWSLNVYVDSPSAAEITRIYARWARERPEAFRPEALAHGSPFDFPNLHLQGSFAEIRRPAVVLAPTSDLSAGRMVEHLRRYAGDPTTRICFVSSYQEPGSLGDRMVRGERLLEVRGRPLEVRGEVHELGSFSAHADHDEILAWLAGIQGLRRVFVVHGPPGGSTALAEAIRSRLGLPATVAEMDRVYRLP